LAKGDWQSLKASYLCSQPDIISTVSFFQALQDIFSSPVTETAAWGGATCFLLSVLIVLTKKLHGSATMDLSHGVQKFHTTPTPRVGGLPIVLVLRMLQDNSDMTHREIAEKLGISTSGLNYCRNALINKGWVRLQNFSQSKNKFGYIYILTPKGIAHNAILTGLFLQRKMGEFEALKAEIELLQSEAAQTSADQYQIT
jgi:EPS-associated MarR family transcriptional regulator